MNEVINPGMEEKVVDREGKQVKNLFRFLLYVRKYIAILNNQGFSGTIVTAKLTGGGTNGSMTFTNGVLTSSTPAT